MKKLGLLALVLGMIVAFAVPAMSFTIEGAKGEKMYIGAAIFTDIAAWNQSKERTGTGTDNTQFVEGVAIHSRVRGFLEIGNVGGYWEFGNGGNEPNTFSAGNVSGFSNSYVETRKLYGYYKFGNCELRVGKDDGYYWTVAPNQVLGLNWGALHIAGFGWGNGYDSRDPQIRFTQNISKQFGYMVSLLQPFVDVDATVAATDPRRISYGVLPRLAVKLMMNFGPVSLYPAGTIYNTKWDNLTQTVAFAGKNPDDNVTHWQVVLPVVVKAGPFTGTFEGYYGQNDFNIIYSSFASAFHQYGRDADGKIKNTTGMGGFVDLAYTVGPVTPHVYFGYDNAKNSDIYKVGDDNNTRLMYGGSVSIKIAEGFFVVPEFTYYDFGKKPGDPAKTSLGSEWLGGVQFQFLF